MTKNELGTVMAKARLLLMVWGKPLLAENVEDP